MKIIFDHCTPWSLARHLKEHDVTSAKAKGWNKIKNGELLQLSVDAGYDVMITADQGIEYENNIAAHRIAVITLTSPRWPDVKKRIPEIKRALQNAKQGRAITVEIPTGKKSRKQPEPSNNVNKIVRRQTIPRRLQEAYEALRGQKASNSRKHPTNRSKDRGGR